jgi:hypothetical protein
VLLVLIALVYWSSFRNTPTHRPSSGEEVRASSGVPSGSEEGGAAAKPTGGADIPGPRGTSGDRSEEQMLLDGARAAYFELKPKVDIEVRRGQIDRALALLETYPERFRKTGWWLRSVAEDRKRLEQMKASMERGGPPSPEADSPEADSPGAEGPAAPGGEDVFWASRNSTKYHRPGCKWAKRISKRNLLIFKSRQEAERAGYRPCGVCRPGSK